MAKDKFKHHSHASKSSKLKSETKNTCAGPLNREIKAKADLDTDSALSDEQLDALYSKRKTQHLSTKPLNQSLQNRLDQELHSRVDIGQYQRFGWLKSSLLLAMFVVLVLPLFAFIQHQIHLINLPENIANTGFNRQGDDGIGHNVELYLPIDANSEQSTSKIAKYRLPEWSQNLRESLTFTSIVASSKQHKLQQFNQQIEDFISSSNLQLDKQQQNLYANAVAKGKLIKQKDLWFIEFCGEQPLLLAMDIIEETLLADPLLDETREGSFFDLYSNPTGVIAMLETSTWDAKQCRD